MKTNDELMKELAEAKAKIADIEKQLQAQKKDDWWTPLGFNSEPLQGDWVFAWNEEEDNGHIVKKFICRECFFMEAESKKKHYEYHVMETSDHSGVYRHIGPFHMPMNQGKYK